MTREPNCKLFIKCKRKAHMPLTISDIIGDVDLLAPEYLRSIFYYGNENLYSDNEEYIAEYDETSKICSKHSNYLEIINKIAEQNKQKTSSQSKAKEKEDYDMYLCTDAFLTKDDGITIQYGDNPVSTTSIHISDDTTVSLKAKNSPLPMLVFSSKYPVYVSNANDPMSRFLFHDTEEDDSHQIKLITRKLNKNITEDKIKLEISYSLELDSSRIEDVSFSVRAVLSAERN